MTRTVLRWNLVLMCVVWAGVGAASAAPPMASIAGDLNYVVEQFHKGGRTMYFILFLSVMGMAFVLERLVHLRRDSIVPAGLSRRARELWAAGKFGELKRVCEASNSSLGRILKFAVDRRSRPLSELNQALSDLGGRELRPHLRRCYPLAVVATLAPLFGLYGTVIGMIGAFDNFRLLGETGEPSVFAADIAVALITTAGGLVVAIPALGLYHFFKSRANKWFDQLEDEASGLFMEWFLPGEKEEGHADPA